MKKQALRILTLMLPLCLLMSSLALVACSTPYDETDSLESGSLNDGAETEDPPRHAGQPRGQLRRLCLPRA